MAYYKMGDMVLSDGRRSGPGTGSGVPSYMNAGNYQPGFGVIGARHICGDHGEIGGTTLYSGGKEAYRELCYEHYKENHSAATAKEYEMTVYAKKVA